MNTHLLTLTLLIISFFSAAADAVATPTKGKWFVCQTRNLPYSIASWRPRWGWRTYIGRLACACSNCASPPDRCWIASCAWRSRLRSTRSLPSDSRWSRCTGLEAHRRATWSLQGRSSDFNFWSAQWLGDRQAFEWSSTACLALNPSLWRLSFLTNSEFAQVFWPGMPLFLFKLWFAEIITSCCPSQQCYLWWTVSLVSPWPTASRWPWHLSVWFDPPCSYPLSWSSCTHWIRSMICSLHRSRSTIDAFENCYSFGCPVGAATHVLSCGGAKLRIMKYCFCSLRYLVANLT